MGSKARTSIIHRQKDAFRKSQHRARNACVEHETDLGAWVSARAAKREAKVLHDRRVDVDRKRHDRRVDGDRKRRAVGGPPVEKVDPPSAHLDCYLRVWDKVIHANNYHEDGLRNRDAAADLGLVLLGWGGDGYTLLTQAKLGPG